MLQAAQAGAGWAFQRIFEDLSPAVAGYLRLRGSDDPEGTTNEVFLGAFRNIGSFAGGETEFRSWLFTIAHRRLVDERRRAAVRPRTAPLDAADLEALRGDVEEDALARLGAEWVRELLDGLTPDQRDVLLLRIVGDLTVEQVAEVLGKRAGAVKMLQRRGLDVLRRELAERGVTL